MAPDPDVTMTAERLQELLTLLQDTGARLSALAVRKEALATELQRGVESACDTLGQLRSGLGEFERQLAADVDAFGPALLALETSTKGAFDALDHSHTTLSASVGEAQEGLTEQATALRSSAEEAGDAVDQLSNLVGELHDAQDAHRGESASAFEAFGHALHDHEQELLAAHHTASGGIHAAHQDVLEHTHASQEAMNSFNESVKAAIHKVVDEAFTDLGHKAKESFEAYVHGSQARAHNWTDVVTHALEEAAVHATERIAGEVANGVEQVVEKGIELLAEEVAHQVGAMTAGASMTTALAPVLPELVVAKGLLHLLNILF